MLPPVFIDMTSSLCSLKKMTTKLPHPKKQNLSIISNKNGVTKAARSACSPITQVLFLRKTIMFWYAIEMLQENFLFCQMKY